MNVGKMCGVVEQRRPQRIRSQIVSIAEHDDVAPRAGQRHIEAMRRVDKAYARRANG